MLHIAAYHSSSFLKEQHFNFKLTTVWFQMGTEPVRPPVGLTRLTFTRLAFTSIGRSAFTRLAFASIQKVSIHQCRQVRIHGLAYTSVGRSAFTRLVFARLAFNSVGRFAFTSIGRMGRQNNETSETMPWGTEIFGLREHRVLFWDEGT